MGGSRSTLVLKHAALGTFFEYSRHKQSDEIVLGWIRDVKNSTIHLSWCNSPLADVRARVVEAAHHHLDLVCRLEVVRSLILSILHAVAHIAHEPSTAWSHSLQHIRRADLIVAERKKWFLEHLPVNHLKRTT